MNMKFVKRIFAVSMAATIMVVPMVASAATKTAQQTRTAETTTTSSSSTTTEVKSEGEKLNETLAAKTEKSANAYVDGQSYKTDVAGTVDVTSSKNIAGFILNSAGGKTYGDKQTVFSKTATESPAAYASANAAAAALGGKIISDGLNANIFLKNGGTATIVLKEAVTGSVKVIQIGDNGETNVLDATVSGRVVKFAPSNGHFTYYVASF